MPDPCPHLLKRLLNRLLPTAEGEVRQLSIPGLTKPLHMYLHGTGEELVSKYIKKHGIWEPDETLLITTLLQSEQVFIDVGANIGYFTLLASAIVGDKGQVFAFEPDVENYALLEKNCRSNRITNTDIVDAALGDNDGESVIYINQSNLGDLSMYSEDKTVETRPIRVVHGSQFLANKIPRADFIKIDTQGAEHQVITGMRDFIEASLPQLTMIVEFSPNSLKLAGSGGIEFLVLLNSFNLTIYIFDFRTKGLLECSQAELEKWVKITEMDPDSEGFVNLICTGAPLKSTPELAVRAHVQGDDNALIDCLVASIFQEWDGSPCASAQFKKHLYFIKGWSLREPWGVWSDGPQSIIKFSLPNEVALCRQGTVTLSFKGSYYIDGGETQIRINQQPIGAYRLGSCEISLPAEVFCQPHVEITLQHPVTESPASRNGVNDERQLAYGLEQLSWQLLE